MRIMLAYPGHAASTIDVADGYYKALTDLGYKVWSYDYHCRLAFYRKACEYWKENNPNHRLKESDFVILSSEPIAIEAIDFRPDVVLMVNGMSFHMRGYELLAKLGVPVVFLLTESPYADEVQAVAVRNTRAAGALVNDRNSVDYISENAGIPATYLPHSYNPEVHHPRDVEDLRYHTDVFFYGTLWPERKELFANITSRNGHRFLVDGVDPALKRDEAHKFKIIQNANMAQYYCGTKIAINHNRTLCGVDTEGQARQQHIQPGDAYSLGPRAFEIAACGAFQLCDDTRQELFDIFGESIPAYKDADDLISKIDYYLNHENERKELAYESLRKVQGCTFVERTEKVVIPFLKEVLNGSS